MITDNIKGFTGKRKINNRTITLKLSDNAKENFQYNLTSGQIKPRLSLFPLRHHFFVWKLKFIPCIWTQECWEFTKQRYNKMFAAALLVIKITSNNKMSNIDHMGSHRLH